jgi:hypothetical protein
MPTRLRAIPYRAGCMAKMMRAVLGACDVDRVDDSVPAMCLRRRHRHDARRVYAFDVFAIDPDADGRIARGAGCDEHAELRWRLIVLETLVLDGERAALGARMAERPLAGEPR